MWVYKKNLLLINSVPGESYQNGSMNVRIRNNAVPTEGIREFSPFCRSPTSEVSMAARQPAPVSHTRQSYTGPLSDSQWAVLTSLLGWGWGLIIPL